MSASLLLARGGLRGHHGLATRAVVAINTGNACALASVAVASTHEIALIRAGADLAGLTPPPGAAVAQAFTAHTIFLIAGRLAGAFVADCALPGGVAQAVTSAVTDAVVRAVGGLKQVKLSAGITKVTKFALALASVQSAVAMVAAIRRAAL
jgi:hypothetical protein